MSYQPSRLGIAVPDNAKFWDGGSNWTSDGLIFELGPRTTTSQTSNHTVIPT